MRAPEQVSPNIRRGREAAGDVRTLVLQAYRYLNHCLGKCWKPWLLVVLCGLCSGDVARDIALAGIPSGGSKHLTSGDLLGWDRQAIASGVFHRLTSSRLIGAAAASESVSPQGRVIVLGFDGFDPELTEQWMADGTLPNFARLAREGHYQTLPTTNPAQSPVAWSSFATGLDPGEHGIFDFLRRNPENYAPEYSISYVEEPEAVLRAFGYQIPLDGGAARNRRVGTPFWIGAEREGYSSSVLRVPVTYPAEPISRMLSGMGVPDLLGTQGTFTLYTTEEVEEESTGGRLMTVEAEGDRIETTFEGPMHPLYQQPVPLEIPLTMERAGPDRVRITFDAQQLELGSQSWSDWVPVEFGFASIFGVKGLVRLYLIEPFPAPKLYVSPIQLDPRAPVGPISMPPDYAAKLAERIGLYHTIGMPEETWSLNEEQISDQAYLEMVETILAEREAMLFDTLERKDSRLVVAVFVQPDRVSHMFWRGIDPQHPLYGQTDEIARSAIKWIYSESDRILGRVLDSMQPEDRLIVLSDHGFDTFRRAVHLNRWLADEGYLTLKPGQPTSDSLFANVDWPRTKAFALGLNGIFLNLRGREALGIVREEDAAALKQEIASKLEGFRDPAIGAPVVVRVYDRDKLYHGQRAFDAPDLVIGYGRGYRASWQTALGGVPEALVEDNTSKWSGDHCIEPSLVPGVLFTSFRPGRQVASIGEVPTLIQATLGLDGTVQKSRIEPSPGVFGAASPVFAAVDGLMSGWLPALGRLTFWGIAAAFLTMGLYRLTSNQSRLAVIKEESGALQSRLAGFDGPFSEAWPLLRRNFSLAGRRLWFTFVPSVIASLPVIFILVWVSNTFDARLPESGEPIEVEAFAGDGQQLPPLRWRGADGGVVEGSSGAWTVPWPEPGRAIELIDSDGTVLLTLPTPEPGTIVHQREWWNALIGNPAGYLPSPGAVDHVSLGLPQAEFLPFGPDWLRGWIPFFFGVLIVFSLLLKFLWRLR
jgi:predicted AlkP superfamily phosphohydrolase/phosphomutase